MKQHTETCIRCASNWPPLECTSEIYTLKWTRLKEQLEQLLEMEQFASYTMFLLPNNPNPRRIKELISTQVHQACNSITYIEAWQNYFYDVKHSILHNDPSSVDHCARMAAIRHT
jgi:hypothetical protein